VLQTKAFVLQEATINTLVTIEVACWFFVGEIIGKGTVIGYNIPGAIDWEVHIWCAAVLFAIGINSLRIEFSWKIVNLFQVT